MKTYMCIACGLMYDEAAGMPQDGIQRGTAWADVPANWRWPACKFGKDDLELVEFYNTAVGERQ